LPVQSRNGAGEVTEALFQKNSLSRNFTSLGWRMAIFGGKRNGLSIKVHRAFV
jgi:hypothetical protein